MSLKEVKRTAAVAWSPAGITTPLLATGTLAGALDASFSTLAELEIHELNLEDKTSIEVTRKTIVSAPSRFNRLAWSAHNNASSDGVIIGGCEDGTLSFWNVSELLKSPNNEAALVARCEAHHGAVRGLQVNPFQPFLVASGAAEAEIWLWDLNNLTQPYAPSATKSAKLEDITDLAWNRIVPHILATASNSGHTVVWDLKSRKEVLQLSTPGQRLSMSAIAWNPENATQILVASDDDQNPVIYSWDLRNARAPEKTLTGHSKGILSMAWCPKDAELLLSCGKDNNSICWNPKSGQVVAELTRSDNWLFDVQWSPRNPDLFSTASFAGLVEVNSFQAIMSGGPRSAPSATTAEDFFTMASSGAVSRVAAPTHMQIPKWLRRPIGVSFGFGGRLISFSSIKSETTKIISIVNLGIPASEELLRESTKLDAALSSQMLIEYCTEKIPGPVPNLHVQDSEAVFWNVAKVMFESNPQEKLMNLLGFDKQQLEEKIRSLTLAEETAHRISPKTLTSLPSKSRVFDPFETTSPPQQQEQRQFPQAVTSPSSSSRDQPKFEDFFGGGEAQDTVHFDFNTLVENGENDIINSHNVKQADRLGESMFEPNPPLPTTTTDEMQTFLPSIVERRGTFQGVPFPLFAPESNEIDRTITRAIILGNFEAAVDLCVKADRLSDALLVAICGGEELVAKTQQIYFQKARFPYLRVVSGIVKKDLSDVVEHAFIDNWEEILALICSYAKGTTFMQLCNILGSRIEAAIPVNAALAMPALICYMAAGNALRAISLVISQQSKNAPAPNYFFEYAKWLEGIVEKTRILEQVAGYVAPQDIQPVQEMVPAISDKFIEYSYVMANAGLLEIAIRYFNSFSTGRIVEGENDVVAVFGDRLAKATRSLNIPIRQVPEPFSTGLDIALDQAKEYAAAQESSIHDGSSSNHQPSLQAQNQQQPQQQPQWNKPTLPSFSTASTASTTTNVSTFSGGLPSRQPSFGAVPLPQQSQFSAPPQQPPFAVVPAAPLASNSFGRPPMIPSVPAIPTPPVAMTSTSFTTVAPLPPTVPSIPNIMPSRSFGSISPISNQQQSQVTPSATIPGPYAAPPVSNVGPSIVSPPNHPSHMVPSMMSQPIASFQSSTVQTNNSITPFSAPPPQASSSTIATHTVTSPTSIAQLRPSLVPQPPRPSATPPPSELPRRTVGAYNDPPMVAPRVPAAPVVSVERSQMMQPAMPNAQSTTTSSSTSTSTTAAHHPPLLAKSSVGPVDPEKIPANLQPIFQTFTNLIMQCQERALPMQRRVVEDSARRMQTLFHQLVNQELSSPVLQIVNEMCANINSGQFDRAHELHTPLMTSYFAEAGAWVLAAKRLIEVAKICLH